MTRLVLHVGYGKTGTTYLQTALCQNRKALLSKGVLYPKMPLGLTKHAPIVPYILGLENPGPYHRTWAQSDPYEESRHHWDDTLAQIAVARPETVIISDETLINSKKRVATLAKNLTPHFSDIRVVAYIDSPQKRLLRVAQQRLRSRGLMPAKLIFPMRQQLSWLASERAFRLDLHSYDRANFPDGDVLAHFVGLYCPVWNEIKPSLPSNDLNTGFSAEAMAVAETYGARWQEQSLIIRQQKWLGMMRALIVADRAVAGFQKPRLRDNVSEYIQRHHPDIAWLRQTHGIEFRDVDYEIASTGNFGKKPNLHVGDLCLVNKEREAAMQAFIESTVDTQDFV